MRQEEMRWFAVAFLALLADPCHAQVRTLIEPAVSGATQVEVYFLNEGVERLEYRPPATLREPRPGEADLLLRATDPTPLLLEPGAFAKRIYTAEPPAAAAAVAAGSSADASATGARHDRDQGILGRLERHEATYVITGAGPEPTKVQFSFDLRLFEGAGPLDGMHFAYTQTMFWATDVESWPFTATTYSPRIYYELELPSTREGASFRLAGGYAHDSSGLAGRGSRDVNRLFGRIAAEQSLGSGWTVEATATAWTFIDWPAPTVRGLEDYWGNFGFDLAVEQKSHVRFEARLRGIETGRGSGEFNVSYPLTTIDSRLPRLYLFGQLFTGFGETLLRHREERTRFRMGLAFVR